MSVLNLGARAATAYDFLDPHQDGSQDIPVFHFESIEMATANFSNSNKLGQGGFGAVYKVPLANKLHDFQKHLNLSQLSFKINKIYGNSISGHST